MGDGLAVGHLRCSTVGIHVDPLVIAGRFSELVDPGLVDDHPVGQADLDTFQCLCIFDGTDDAQLTFPAGSTA